MKRVTLFLFVQFFVVCAHAQIVSTIISQSCNVALSQCSMTDDNGDTVAVQGQWVYSGNVVMNVTTIDGAQPTRSCVASRTPVSQTLYKIIDDLVISCDDGSSLSGTYSATRSGSGRGGWAWHPHVFFDTVILN